MGKLFLKKFTPLVYAQNDQRVMGIILRYVCWGTQGKRGDGAKMGMQFKCRWALSCREDWMESKAPHKSVFPCILQFFSVLMIAYNMQIIFASPMPGIYQSRALNSMLLHQLRGVMPSTASKSGAKCEISLIRW